MPQPLGGILEKSIEMTKAVFRHVNLIAENWEPLAQFYQNVFGCEVVPPVRDLSGDELEAITGIAGVHLRGVHLRLPGYGENGPTLEIFQYNRLSSSVGKDVNSPGFAHVAFEVPDVAKARDEVIRHGGSSLGQIVQLGIPGKDYIVVVYMKDPEGNIIELQSQNR